MKRSISLLILCFALTSWPADSQEVEEIEHLQWSVQQAMEKVAAERHIVHPSDDWAQVSIVSWEDLDRRPLNLPITILWKSFTYGFLYSCEIDLRDASHFDVNHCTYKARKIYSGDADELLIGWKDVKSCAKFPLCDLGKDRILFSGRLSRMPILRGF